MSILADDIIELITKEYPHYNMDAISASLTEAEKHMEHAYMVAEDAPYAKADHELQMRKETL